MDKDILIIKLNMFLKSKDMETLYKGIMAQRDAGLIILPPCCEPMLVPKDVEIKFEEKENEK